MAEEVPPRKRKRSSGQSSQESLVQCRSRSGSRSTLSSPGSSPRRIGPRKADSPVTTSRRVSVEALEQGITAIKHQYGHRRVSVAYLQGGDHTAAVVTLSQTNSPVMERARVHSTGSSSNGAGSKYSSNVRGSTGHGRKSRRQTTAVIEQTKSSLLGAPRTPSGPRTSPRSRSSSSGQSKSSLSSPALIDSPRGDKQHHHHHLQRGHSVHRTSGHPTSKTALLSSHGSSHWDKSKAASASVVADDLICDDDLEEESRGAQVQPRQHKGRRGLEMAVAGCVMLLGTGALLIAFMWGGDTAWTILGSTCMSLGALFLVLGVCWYLSKTRDGAQEEKLEIRVVDAKQMAKLIKQGFKVKPVEAV